MLTADWTTETTTSWSAPADSANSKQCDANSSVADARAVLILEFSKLVLSAAVMEATAVASPATQRAAWAHNRLLLLQEINKNHKVTSWYSFCQAWIVLVFVQRLLKSRQQKRSRIWTRTPLAPLAFLVYCSFLDTQMGMNCSSEYFHLPFSFCEWMDKYIDDFNHLRSTNLCFFLYPFQSSSWSLGLKKDQEKHITTKRLSEWLLLPLCLVYSNQSDYKRL